MVLFLRRREEGKEKRKKRRGNTLFPGQERGGPGECPSVQGKGGKKIKRKQRKGTKLIYRGGGEKRREKKNRQLFDPKAAFLNKRRGGGDGCGLMENYYRS